MIKTFVSYHHANDQEYKNALVDWAEGIGLITNMSVETGEIDEDQPTQSIRRTIRDDYLRDTEVTILLCGAETRYRKHVDWELKSSMIDGSRNRQSGILVIDLPESKNIAGHVGFPDEKSIVYPSYNGNWISLENKADYLTRYESLPRRIIDNLFKTDVKISVVSWDRVYGKPESFKFLLANSASYGKTNPYDLSLPMRMKNFNPNTDAIDVRR